MDILFFNNFSDGRPLHNDSNFSPRLILKFLHNASHKLINVLNIGSNMNNLKVLLNQVSEKTNIFSSLKFIPGNHHYFHPCLLQPHYSLRNLVLELVLNGSCSKYA